MRRLQSVVGFKTSAYQFKKTVFIPRFNPIKAFLRK